MLIQAPKGTRDILPPEIHSWRAVEEIFFKTLSDFGFEEIRTPVFEYTEIFLRTVGETTDIVQKEMYTFNDKGGRSLTLRPEGTAGIARSYIENGLASLPSPVKLGYNITAYRYENVAKGRYREFHQFGAEVFGSPTPLADAELIVMADVFFRSVGINDHRIEINSIGCAACRPEYNKELEAFFADNISRMCNTCGTRLHTNPLRILDCKEDECRHIAKDAPSILDYLCVECKDHFESLKHYLEALGIDYIINDRIVRGLDYYTKTVFEFMSENVGTQGTICGGGRYDTLITQFNGSDVPGAGFALGVERLLMHAAANGITLAQKKRPLLYIASVGEKARAVAASHSYRLRRSGIRSENDTMYKSLKAQMKYADKINAKYSLVIGDDEIENDKAVLKNMDTKESREIKLSKLTCELQKTEEIK